MKGKQLTLQEVLNLEDGSKVWVEDSGEHWDNTLCKYDKGLNSLLDMSENLESEYDLDFMQYYDDRLTFYEWTNDEDDMKFSRNIPSHTKIELDMAQEICNLRGLDLTDDNIRLIIEEFEEEK